MNTRMENTLSLQQGTIPSAADRYLASAALYDLLSRCFSYPGPELYATLQQPEFVAQLSAAVETLGDSPALRSAHGELQAAVVTTLSDCPLSQLESDYIALFDASRDQPALHPYARLYGEQIMNPAILLQKLQAIYSDHGLILDADKGAEQADHITVQLEFMALLFQRLAQAPDDSAALGATEAFLLQLAWLPRFVAKLEERNSPHCLYHPLAQFLVALFNCTLGRTTVAE